MKTIYCAAAVFGVALSSCSGGDEAANTAVEDRAASLQPGEYELTMAVKSLRSTDNTTPATSMTEGSQPVTTRTCVGADNTIDPAAFVEAAENCTAGDTYMSGGRMSLQFRCNRAGKGMLSHLVDGEFKKDSFSGDVITTTIFSGSGDYELTRSFEAKRVGECTAQAS